MQFEMKRLEEKDLSNETLIKALDEKQIRF
jgi:hypothetical protein